LEASDSRGHRRRQAARLDRRRLQRRLLRVGARAERAHPPRRHRAPRGPQRRSRAAAEGLGGAAPPRPPEQL